MVLIVCLGLLLVWMRFRILSVFFDKLRSWINNEIGVWQLFSESWVNLSF